MTPPRPPETDATLRPNCHATVDRKCQHTVALGGRGGAYLGTRFSVKPTGFEGLRGRHKAVSSLARHANTGAVSFQSRIHYAASLLKCGREHLSRWTHLRFKYSRHADYAKTKPSFMIDMIRSHLHFGQFSGSLLMPIVRAKYNIPGSVHYESLLLKCGREHVSR